MAVEADRGSWGTHIGFILAAVGAAVGFGNIVRFPAFVAQSGGAAFVILYLLIALVVGVPAFIAEMSIGREGRGDPITSFRRLGGKRWAWAGTFFVVSALLFVGFYLVFNGYVVLYLWEALTSASIADPVGFFNSVEEGPMTLLATALVAAAAVGVLSFGVSGGIERAGLVMIPSLFVIVLGISIYGLFQAGASEGLRFFLSPDLSAVTWGTVVDAMGQAFFSLGVGLGTLVTYGSYLDRDSDLPLDAVTISAGDTLVAIMAGMMVFPLLFAFGLQGAVTSDDINAFGVLFVTLPETFASIGGVLGSSLQVLFFLALFFGVFSSAIAVLEVPVATMVDRFGIPRRKAVILAGEIAFGLAILPALSESSLVLMDRISATIALPLAALIAVVFAGFRIKDAANVVDRGGRWRVGRPLLFWWRTILPVVIAVVLVVGLAQTFL